MKNTIKAHAHFSFVMHFGKKVALPVCICYILPIEYLALRFGSYQNKKFTYGVMATKRLIGNAVERNAVKRKLRTCIQKLEFDGYAIVFFVRPLAKEIAPDRTFYKLKKLLSTEDCQTTIATPEEMKKFTRVKKMHSKRAKKTKLQ